MRALDSSVLLVEPYLGPPDDVSQVLKIALGLKIAMPIIWPPPASSIAGVRQTRRSRPGWIRL